MLSDSAAQRETLELQGLPRKIHTPPCELQRRMQVTVAGADRYSDGGSPGTGDQN
ncbi:hypothetical protein [Cohnella sp.]|uniref:hypothetical protein n=1 Tax=Cohnella sp. TaxID=1883426 RepID=UPI003564DDDB